MTAAPTPTVFSRPCAPTAPNVGIAAFQRAGMLDWPGRLAATVFMAGCTLRCPYCHNPELVASARHSQPLDDLIEHIRSRRGWLDGVVITGGEPTASHGLFEILAMLRSEGVPVKLDTNGTDPDVLTSILARDLVDFVALDVKATPERYERATGSSTAWPRVERSITAIMDSKVAHEFRTTCYPLAVGPNDLVHIASRLAGGDRYVLQQFRPHRTLDAAAVSVRPHAASTLCTAAERCSAFLPTSVRGA